MSARDDQLLVWQQAAAALGFRFVTPFHLDTPGGPFDYFRHLPEFGSENGMLVIVGNYNSAQLDAAQFSGYGFSCLSESAEPYDRAVYIEMLSDWGWCGPANRMPSWYTEPKGEQQ